MQINYRFQIKFCEKSITKFELKNAFLQKVMTYRGKQNGVLDLKRHFLDYVIFYRHVLDT